jgi:hypothetical protein
MRRSSLAGLRKLPAIVCALFLFTTASYANTAPAISGTPSYWTYVGSPYSFTPTASDAEGATLRYSIENKPGWATFSTSTGRLSGTPFTVGLWMRIRILVSDGTTTVALPGFSIRATSKDNVAPTISGSPATSVVAGSSYSFTPVTSDANGDPLRFSIANKPVWASFSAATGRLSGTPGKARIGTYLNIVITANDGSEKVSLPAFSITVKSATNRAPTISGTPGTSVVAGQGYSFRPAASDADGDTLGFSIQNRPAWAAFSSATGQLSGTPSATHAGSYSNVIISVSDGKATVALAPFTVTVTAPNAAPVISGSPATSVNAGSAYSFRPSASDANGDALTFAIANRPTWASFNTATGQLSGTPAAVSVGTYSNIVVSVSDGKASATLPAFAITVADVSVGAATLSWIPPTTNTDGSTLTNLAGFRIYYGASSSQMSQTIEVANASVNAYVVSNLAPGTYYFTVRAYTASGAESDNSNVSTKTVQ